MIKTVLAILKDLELFPDYFTDRHHVGVQLFLAGAEKEL